MVSIATALRTALSGLGLAALAREAADLAPAAEPWRRRCEARDLAVLRGALPASLFDSEPTSEASPRSPFYSRGR